MALQLALPKSRIVRFTLPHIQSPILMRSKTMDYCAFEQVFMDGDYEIPADPEPQFILDGGAHAGYASIYFANKFPNARIISVEPEPSNFQMLVENTKHYSNVTPINAAIWNRRTRLDIINPDDKNMSFQVGTSSSGNGLVETITLDEILNMSDHHFIDILKLDIEGAEKEVFSSSENWLERVGILIVELHERFKPGVNKAFHSALEKYNFKYFSKGENIILIRESFNR